MCCGWNYHQYISSTSRVSFLVENWITELPWQGLEAQWEVQGAEERPCCVALHWHLLPEREQNYTRQRRGGSGCDCVLSCGTHIFEITLLLVPHLHRFSLQSGVRAHKPDCFLPKLKEEVLLQHHTWWASATHGSSGLKSSPVWILPEQGCCSSCLLGPSCFTTQILFHCDCQCRQLQASKGILVERVGGFYAQTCTLKNPSLSCQINLNSRMMLLSKCYPRALFFFLSSVCVH